MKKQLLKRILQRCYRCISTALIVLAVICAVLFLCGVRIYYVRSGSMGNAVPFGSLCFVSTYSPYENISVGDIISFRLDEDIFVTHRAISRTEQGVFTQGDCNENADPDPVTPENYIGKTLFAIPYLGAAFERLRSAGGIIALSLFLLLLMMLGHFSEETK